MTPTTDSCQDDWQNAFSSLYKDYNYQEQVVVPKTASVEAQAISDLMAL